jgi:hypothetical protein
MTLAVVLWVFLAAVAAWGSAYFARRDRRSTSRMKIAFAGILLLGFLVTLAGSHWIGGDMIGEGLSAHVMLFVIWPIAVVGAPLCLGSMVGTLVGMYQSQNLSPF